MPDFRGKMLAGAERMQRTSMSHCADLYCLASEALVLRGGTTIGRHGDQYSLAHRSVLLLPATSSEGTCTGVRASAEDLCFKTNARMEY